MVKEEAIIKGRGVRLGQPFVESVSRGGILTLKPVSVSSAPQALHVWEVRKRPVMRASSLPRTVATASSARLVATAIH